MPQNMPPAPSNRNALEQELLEAQRQLDAYLDLSTDQQDDDAFIARGNGFSDHKYSDDFLDLRIAQLTARVSDLRRRLEP